MATVDDFSITHTEANNAIATIMFAHGAGADMNSDFIAEFTALLINRHINVIRFNFPYMQQRLMDGKRRPPNKMPVLCESYLQRIKQFKSPLPLFIGGKSMGSRVAAMVANEQKVNAVFCLGYPFHPQKQPDKLRLEPLQKTQKPVLIVQGDRDLLGNKEEIKHYALPANIQMEFLPDGDHDLKPRVKSGHNHRQHKIAAADLVLNFIKTQINIDKGQS